MIGNRFPKAARPLLIKGARPIGFEKAFDQPVDILIGTDGRIAEIGKVISAGDDARTLDGKGAWMSPGWTDIHVHVWYGGTDISLKPDAVRGRAWRHHHGRCRLGRRSQLPWPA